MAGIRKNDPLNMEVGEVEDRKKNIVNSVTIMDGKRGSENRGAKKRDSVENHVSYGGIEAP